MEKWNNNTDSAESAENLPNTPESNPSTPEGSPLSPLEERSWRFPNEISQKNPRHNTGHNEYCMERELWEAVVVNGEIIAVNPTERKPGLFILDLYGITESPRLTGGVLLDAKFFPPDQRCLHLRDSGECWEHCYVKVSELPHYPKIQTLIKGYHRFVPNSRSSYAMPKALLVMFANFDPACWTSVTSVTTYIVPGTHTPPVNVVVVFP